MSTTTCLIGMPPERPPDPARALAAESHGIARPATPSAPAPLSTSRRPIRWSKIDGLLPPIFPPGTNVLGRFPSKTPVGCHTNHVPLKPGVDGVNRSTNHARRPAGFRRLESRDLTQSEWRGQLQLDVVGIAKRQDADPERRQLPNLASGDATLVELADCLVERRPALHAEAQVVEPNPVLVELVALGRNRPQPQQVSALAHDAPAP